VTETSPTDPLLNSPKKNNKKMKQKTSKSQIKPSSENRGTLLRSFPITKNSMVYAKGYTATKRNEDPIISFQSLIKPTSETVKHFFTILPDKTKKKTLCFLTNK